MALPSDEQNADSRLQVRFYKRPVQQEQESIEAGRPIFKEFDFVHICVAGDTLTEIDTYALPSHKTRFPLQLMKNFNSMKNHRVITFCTMKTRESPCGKPQMLSSHH